MTAKTQKEKTILYFPMIKYRQEKRRPDTHISKPIFCSFLKKMPVIGKIFINTCCINRFPV